MNTLEASAHATLANAERSYNDLVDQQNARIGALPDTSSPSEVDNIEAEFKPRIDAADAQVQSTRRQVESTERISRARAGNPLVPAGDGLYVSEPDLYRQDGEHSYISDLFRSQHRNDQEAQKRLNSHNEERRRNSSTIEARATFNDTGFYPPQWLDSLWIDTKRPATRHSGTRHESAASPIRQPA